MVNVVPFHDSINVWSLVPFEYEPTATQSVALRHDNPESVATDCGSALADETDQSEPSQLSTSVAAAAGSGGAVRPIATQLDALVQDTFVNDPPSVGEGTVSVLSQLVPLQIDTAGTSGELPASPTAAQNVMDAHDTSCIWLGLSVGAGLVSVKAQRLPFQIMPSEVNAPLSCPPKSVMIEMHAVALPHETASGRKPNTPVPTAGTTLHEPLAAATPSPAIATPTAASATATRNALDRRRGRRTLRPHLRIVIPPVGRWASRRRSPECRDNTPQLAPFQCVHGASLRCSRKESG
jgi:hypothetical protein